MTTASSSLISHSAAKRGRSPRTASSSPWSQVRLPVHRQWATKSSSAARSGSSSASPRPVLTRAAVAFSDISVSWVKSI